jgi:hypothetical protein
MWESAIMTADNTLDLECCVYVDYDDSVTQNMCNLLQSKYLTQFKYIVGPRVKLSQMVNKAYEISSGELLQFAGDDILFKTQGWDTKIRDAFDKYPDKIALIYGDDGHYGKEFATHPVLHRKWAEVVGYASPPYFSSDYCDTWLFDIAKGLGRLEYVDYLVDHMHPSWGKGETDEVYREGRERTVVDRNDILYQQLTNKRIEDLEKLKRYIDESTPCLLEHK